GGDAAGVWCGVPRRRRCLLSDSSQTRPACTARSVPCPRPVFASDPNRSTVTSVTCARLCDCWSSATNASGARQGPSVCELDGPTPTLNMSKTDSRSDIGSAHSGDDEREVVELLDAAVAADVGDDGREQRRGGVVAMRAQDVRQALFAELLARLGRRLAHAVRE